MNRKCIFLVALFLMAAATASAQEDLFLKKKSDSAIKPLVFPLSMAVIENRPLKGHYYFYEGDSAKFDAGLEGKLESGDNNFNAILSDPAMIKKNLGATDRARINPSKRSEDVRGPITRLKLKEIAGKVSKDLILVFRREVRVKATYPLPSSVFLKPDEFFTYQWPGPYTVKIKTQGLVYLTKQNKMIAIPANEKSKSFITKGEHVTGENLQAGWKQLAKEGLEDLAVSAKKAILDKQFVVRRPTY